MQLSSERSVRFLLRKIFSKQAMTTLFLPAVPFSSYTQPNRKRKADDMSGLAVCLDFSHVVVDTNCVLDHLAQIVAIAEDYHLNVVVPFIGTYYCVFDLNKKRVLTLTSCARTRRS